jgi:D-amino-acid dehydrogenase
MRVAVIGAGIVGVTTAYELSVDGHEVTVFERRPAVATEASFANAGVLAPGYVTPWAAPGMPARVLRQLLGRHAAVRIGSWSALALLPWVWRWWQACAPAIHRRNRAAMQGLALYSQARMHRLTDALQLDYELASGLLVLLRGERDAAAAAPGLQLLQELGVEHSWLNAAAAHAVEPGLDTTRALAGAIHLPQDGVGNCRHFAHQLKVHAQRLGAAFRFGHQVVQLRAGPQPGLTWRHAGTGGQAGFDAVVVCAGAQAGDVLRGCGVSLPLVPVYGHAITAPLRLHEHAPAGPRSAVMDEHFKVAISRLGQRVRVAGGAELGGRIGHANAKAVATLHRVLADWFPGTAPLRDVQVWKGARPMLPDGPPVLGASGAAGIWLNLGHGASGWMLACGSARVLSDLIGGRPAGLDLSGLDRSRLQR